MRLAKILAVVLALTIMVSGASLWAQTATGEVNGVISDPSGALLPGAGVSLTNQNTKIVREVITNDSGYYVFVNVQPGVYLLHVAKPGFKATDVPRLQVTVAQTLVQNLKLSLGQVAETVEVTAQAALVDASTTELGAVVSTRLVNDLPLNGRNFTQLMMSTPGVTPVSTSQQRNVSTNVETSNAIPGSGFSDASFHGQENRSKLYFFDGIINTNIRGPSYIVLPNIDLVQEFKIVAHDAKAEFGGTTGGVMNMVSKAGGNNFHGSAFEYVRNNFFDARNTFTDGPNGCTAIRCPKAGQLVPTGPAPFRQNQFGATVTGPIIKNRTFFSGGYDGWRFSQPGLGLSYVPTAAELNGDFTSTSPGFKRQIFNPYSTRAVGANFVRDAFRCDAAGNPLPVGANNQQSQTTGVVCNKIPQALIFAPMQKFLQQYATTPNFSSPSLLTSNFVQTRASTNNANSYQVRVDHRFRDADNIFFRYTEHRVSVLTPIGEAGSTGGSSQGRNYGGAWTHTFGRNLIFDVRAGYAGRPGVDSSQWNQHPAGLDAAKSAGFVDTDKYSGLLVRLSDWTNGGSSDFGVRGIPVRQNPNWSMTPNLIWLKGRHNLKAGFWFIDAKRIQLNTFQRYTFSDDQTRCSSTSQTGCSSTTGLSLASALLGFPGSFEAQLPTQHGGPIQFKYASWAAYLQDEWKVTPTVTLSMGLRYDYLTQPQTLDGHMWNSLDIAHQRYILGAEKMPALCSVAAQAPCIPDAFQNDPHFANVVVAGKKFFAPPPIKDNWGPRVGLAWQFTPKTVLRTGYGVYFDSLAARSQYAQNDLEAFTWPDAVAFNGTANVCANGSTCAFTNGTAIDIISQQKKGFATPLPVYSGVTGLPWNGYPNQGDDPRYKDPYSQEWHVELQRELTPNMMVAAAYVGSKTERLPYGAGNANAASQAFPNGTPTATVDATRQMPWVTAGLTYSRSIGLSHYNALETRFRRRFANGLQTQANYTWGKSTDVSSGYFNVENGSGPGGNGGSSTIQNYYDMKTARGLSSYDVAHFFSWATVYELPFGPGKKWVTGGPLSWLVGGWHVNYIFSARSGQPYNLVITGDLANLRGSAPAGPNNYLRPNLIADPFVAGPVAANPDPNCQKTISQGGRAADAVHTPASWFNPCAFGIPIGAFGNLGRNAFRGPHVVNLDSSVFKTIPIREGMDLQLRFEAFNALNVQNYNTPSGVTVNTNATTIAGNVGRITDLVGTPRQLQLGLRFEF